MALAPAVRRLHNDLVKLRKARKEGDNDHRDLRNDSKALNRDTKELAKDRAAGDVTHKKLDQVNQQLRKDIGARDAKLKTLDAQKTVIDGKLAADTFDHDAFTPGVQQDPALLAALADMSQKRTDTVSTFGAKIQAGETAKNGFQDKIVKLRAEIEQDKKAVVRGRKIVQHDRMEIKHDRAFNKKLRAIALKHLRPAELHMGLKTTNRVRRELGLRRVNHVIRPINLNTVKGCAQFLLNSKNVSFWSGLSTGSDRKNLERLARGERAMVPATGGSVIPKLSMMKALVAMAKRGHIQINALTGGSHSSNSNHYRGTAVDLHTANAGMITSVARRFGGFRNSESSHIHLDF